MQPFYSFRKEEFSLHPGTKRSITLIFVFLGVWVSLRWLYPLVSPFVLGTLLALLAEPVVAALHRRVHIPRALSAGIGVSAAFFLLAMMLLLVAAFVVRELRALAGVLPDLEQTARSGISLVRSWLLDLSARAPKSLRPMVRENVNALFSDGNALVDRGVSYLLSLAGNLLSHVPDSAFTLGTAVLSGYMISAKLPRIRRWIRRRIPREKLRTLRAAGKRLKATLGCWFTAQFKLMSVTFVILFLGLVLLRIPYALLWAAGISLVDAFPVLGTGTVLLPWCVYLLLQGDTARAVGIGGIYLVISLTRSVLEPRLLGRHLGLDPLATLVLMYAGYKLWGIGGMILAPLLAVAVLRILPEQRREQLP